MPQFWGKIEPFHPFDVITGPVFEIKIAPPTTLPRKVSRAAFAGPHLFDTYVGRGAAAGYGVERNAGVLTVQIRDCRTRSEADPISLSAGIAGLVVDHVDWNNHIVLGWDQLRTHFELDILGDQLSLMWKSQLPAIVADPCNPF